MIAQRKKFEAKKEQMDLNNRMKKNKKFAETSISNFSDSSTVDGPSNIQSDNYSRSIYDSWDTARIVDTEETYEQRVHFFHLSLQILKVVTYIVLGIVVLFCAIVSKGSLLLMTNAIGHLPDYVTPTITATTTIDPVIIFSFL